MKDLVLTRFIIFTDQLWKITKDKVLLNKSGKWKYEDCKWTLPKEGGCGQIKDIASGQVLGFLTNKAEDHFEVIPQQPKEDVLGQRWQRSEANSDGWFTLHCKEANAFLTNAPSNYLIVTGD